MKKTSIITKQEKITFLAKRILVYGSFLIFIFSIIPLLQDYMVGRVFSGFVYLLYLLGMFFLVGKELDQRIKVYFPINSSLDRSLYRISMGYIITILFFSLLSAMGEAYYHYIFWSYWALWGILYCWPTRGKILKESFLKQISEFRYLDKFEKLLLFLCVILSLISMPYFQEIYQGENFIKYYDPSQYLHHSFWDSLSLMFWPLAKLGLIFTTSWLSFFYFMSMFLFLGAAYCLLRFFFNRRLSLLGVFSMASSWAMVLNFEQNPLYGMFISNFTILWLWAILWCYRSGIYRSGIFIGLLSFYGYLLFKGNIFLFLIILSCILGVMFRDKTLWFKKQFLKYNIPGLLALAMSLIFDHRSLHSLWSFDEVSFGKYWQYSFLLKDFYVLSILGFLLMLIMTFNIKNFSQKFKIYNKDLFEKFIICFLGLGLTSLFFAPQNLSFINAIWILALFSLIPLEWLFQSVRRLRSKSNIIYGLYIVICLLDSRIEGRIKNLIQFFDL